MISRICIAILLLVPALACAAAPLRVPGGAQSQKLVHVTQAVYPPELKNAGIEGDVYFKALIGKDGKVAELTLLSGHSGLAAAADSAIREWVYEPTLLNGEPVQVITQIHVHFALGSAGAGVVPAGRQVRGDVQQLLLTRQVKPAYPPEAKQAGLSGSVELRAVIGKDGIIRNLTVLSGEAMLVEAALDAVKQWEYRPTLAGGEPVEVITDIEINFRLAE